MLKAKICYLGDDDLTRAAAYLGGVMMHYGLEFDHVPSTESPNVEFTEKVYALYIISDYPSSNFTDKEMEHIVRSVHAGSGLLMIGGWESFHGLAGGYEKSPLKAVLPITMRDEDDRRNRAQPCLINKVAEHKILKGLPFDVPSGIGGFNRINPKAEATVLLTSVSFAVHNDNCGFRFEREEEAPLLVIGAYGKGHTAAFATDVAPHWVGGFVDWGNERVTQQVGEGSIEVGNWYAQFLRNLVEWTMKG